MGSTFFKIGIFSIILFFGSHTKKTFPSEFKKLNIGILPIASFLFAQREPMRVGWYNRQNFYQKNSPNDQKNKPIGSLFVQIRPKKFENEYQLGIRLLREGSTKFKLIKKFTKGIELNGKNYITIPFEFLIGSIQGEALRNIFPNDRVVFGGWLHHFTYHWETPELIAKSFTNLNKNKFPQKKYKQGETLTIPWRRMRSDLELQPLALREPLFLKKDESGVRYAFYRFLKGDTLYSSVIIRFFDEKKHHLRNKHVIDLLLLNDLKNAHTISKGQLIKIPLNFIKPKYFHQIPGIYKDFIEYNATKTLPNPKSSNYLLPIMGKTYNINIISQR